jgi:hypothetical protein
MSATSAHREKNHHEKNEKKNKETIKKNEQTVDLSNT